MALSDKEIDAYLGGHTDHLSDDSHVNDYLDGKTDTFALPSEKGGALQKLKALAAQAQPYVDKLISNPLVERAGQAAAVATDPANAISQLVRNRSTVAQEAPAAGGILGATLGGIPGAALGGAAGEGLRQINNAVDGLIVPSSALASKQIGLAAIKQAVLEAGGQVVGKGIEGLQTLGRYTKIGDKLGSLARLPEGSLEAAYNDPTGIIPGIGAPTKGAAQEAYNAAAGALKAGAPKLTLEQAVEKVGKGATNLPQEVMDTVNAIKAGNTAGLTPNQVYQAERALKDATDVAFNRALRPGDDTVKIGKRVLRDQIAPAFQDAYSTVRTYLDKISPEFAAATKGYAQQATFGPMRNLMPLNNAGRPDWAGFGIRSLAPIPGSSLAQVPLVQGVVASALGGAAKVATSGPVRNSALQVLRNYVLRRRAGQ
jgi:hypothetical protein